MQNYLICRQWDTGSMEEIKHQIQSVKMPRQNNGTYYLMLVVLNEMTADILHHRLNREIILSYVYDGTDITFYLVFELLHIDKMFKLAINASVETLKWLDRINKRLVTGVQVAYFDGKGGTIPLGTSIHLQ
ncbi:MAG: hypothetical protein ACXVB6_01055 [Mucilaginibacter sp.]